MTKTVTHKNDLPYFGGEPLLDIAPNRKFSDMIFELLSDKTPDTHQSKLFETILNISIDHGPESPSGEAVVVAAKGGKTLPEAVSAGILQINNVHGGAIEPAMEIFYKIKKESINIKDFIKEKLAEGIRLPGFGHRIYEVDPRTQLLFKLVDEEDVSKEYVSIALEIEKELKEQKGRALPCNIDGSIAAILCAFGWSPKLGKAVFISARAPGLCGQYLENSGI